MLLLSWLLLLSWRRLGGRGSNRYGWSARAGRYRGRGLRLAAGDGDRCTAHDTDRNGPGARADEEIAARRERLEPFA
ncbi:MAG TPA: hypothetical protein VGL99_33365 [Chloroflexota bacterium]